MHIGQKQFQKKTLTKLITILGLVMGLTGLTHQPASANGLTDPLPILFGTTKRAIHVYSVPSVRSSLGTNGNSVTTTFRCASTEKTGGQDIVWAVEVFSSSSGLRNDVTVGQGVLTLPPGDTDVISIYDTAVFVEEGVLREFVSHGSARILATSTKIICSAFLVHPDDAPPTFITPLPVIKRTTQKGH